MKTRYKIINKLFSLLAAFGLATAVHAQTNTNTPPVPPPTFLSLDQWTNIFSAIPSVDDYTQAAVSLDVGALFRHGSVENEIQANFNIHTNYVLSLAMENAPAGNVIDALSASAGYRLAYPNGEIEFKAMGRRNMFTDESLDVHPSWQFGAALRASWRAITGGKLDPYTELRFLSPESMHLSTDKWQFEVVAGLTWKIPGL